MCKCDPSIRSPWCGKGSCHPPRPSGIQFPNASEYMTSAAAGKASKIAEDDVAAVRRALERQRATKETLRRILPEIDAAAKKRLAEGVAAGKKEIEIFERSDWDSCSDDAGKEVYAILLSSLQEAGWKIVERHLPDIMAGGEIHRIVVVPTY